MCVVNGILEYFVKGNEQGKLSDIMIVPFSHVNKSPFCWEACASLSCTLPFVPVET